MAPEKKYRPYVPETMEMKEFTFRAVLIGLMLTVILGAANAYLGLRAGMTIAATYPAAVIGMALLRLMKGSLLEENIARTVGSIGESVAAGAVFTIPAFLISGAWNSFGFRDAYWKSVALMAVGGSLGILFVTLLRRVMVEDPELPFPESVAASEIHKAGQQGAGAAKLLFANMGLGGLIYLLGAFQLFNASKSFVVHIGQIGSSMLRLGRTSTAPIVSVGGVTTFQAPAISPAYLGVGYIIGPRLASLNFAGGVVAWGLLVPLIIYFLGPTLQATLAPGAEGNLAGAVWYNIVRPIAVGGMMVGAGWTLFRMRKSLAMGMRRAVSDLKKSAAVHAATNRTERDLNGKVVFGGLGAAFLCMIVLYFHFSGTLSGAITAAVVMIVVGFFFAAVSGNLVGMIGSSNNPVSGLTLCTLIIAALLMVAIGVSGMSGVAAVLGVAAVVCVSSAVAGEMLQDLKVGHILGGTPAKMQLGDFLGIAVASLALYFPLLVLHQGNINRGGIGFGDPQLSAPQAGLMASLAQGIVGHNMPWPLVMAGVLMGFAMIMLEVKSVMLFAVGMYLPLETTFAIFLGGVIRWLTDRMRDKRGFNDAQKARVENAGVLTASGMIAGEAILGLVVAAFYFFNKPLPVIFATPSTYSGFIVLAIIAFVMVRVPLANAGRPEDPAPPTAIM
ncbi:MAG: oligopeptide transporter, OPT family [Acidobacteria bacterium]|nr:MAG: oligopeptide transporter, OPT family [Acidobacteriota bacterium]PYX42288.1 MAG: oligopeptide transporter, OPT family [Acidobacteriota bacterium]